MKVSKITNSNYFIETFAPELRKLTSEEEKEMAKIIERSPWDREITLYTKESIAIYDCVKITLEKTKEEGANVFILGKSDKEKKESYRFILKMYHGKFDYPDNTGNGTIERKWKIALREEYDDSCKFYRMLFLGE